MSDQPPAPDARPDELELLHGCPVERPRGEQVVFVDRARYLSLVKALADDGYDVCVDVTAVDYLLRPERPLPAGVQPERFEVVTNLLSMRDRQRLRVRVQVPADEPEVASLFDLHPGTEAFEREVYDMFGITFTGHPDLTRILMPEDWEGHPLRKDEAVGRIPVQFSQDEQGRAGEVVQGAQP